MQITRARFISLEGIEGVGKSTQLKFVAKYLRKAGISLTVTREPGGTEVAEAIRALVLQSDFSPETIIPETELLLFFAARAQHIHYVIKPALQRGDWVLCDRFTETRLSTTCIAICKALSKARLFSKTIIQGICAELFCFATSTSVPNVQNGYY